MQHHEMDINGGYVFWKLYASPQDSVRSVFANAGCEDQTPEVYSDSAALKKAMEARKSSYQKVAALKRPKVDGYELVDVERDSDRNHYTHSFAGSVKDGVVTIRGGWADTAWLQQLFDHFKTLVSPSGMAKALVEILTGLGAVTIRGGMYWLRWEQFPAWAPIARGIESIGVNSSENVIHLSETRRDAGALRCIHDALIEEISGTASTIHDEVQNGLGAEAAETRVGRAAELLKRAQSYADLLGEALPRLETIIETTRTAAAVAALQDMQPLPVA